MFLRRMFMEKQEEHEDYPCTLYAGGRCLHFECRLATLPSDLAQKIRRNHDVRWHLLEGWGRFDRQKPRGSKERRILAIVCRAMRKGEIDLGQAVPALLWGKHLTPDEA